MTHSVMPAADTIVAITNEPEWDLIELEFELAPGIRVGKLENSPLNDSLRGYKTGWIGDSAIFILQEPNPEATHSDFDIAEPFARLDRILNVLTIIRGEPQFGVELFYSTDNFRTVNHTNLVWLHEQATELLGRRGYSALDKRLKQRWKLCWKTADQYWEKTKWGGRIVNALTYYYLAWRAHVVEHTCLDLAIVLETLFAPHSQSEISHQIAFNTAWFLGNSKGDRKNIYRDVKQFYSARSEIVHGGPSNSIKMVESTTRMFDMCSRILETILSDPELAERFGNDEKRRELLESYLFA